MSYWRGYEGMRLSSLRSIWKPEVYHGHHKQKRYFEGWYFKFASANSEKRYAVIPGIFLHENPADSHCFVQTLDGITGDTSYHRYPVEEFHAAKDEFDLRVGPNHFRLDHISLDLDSPQRVMKGSVHFGDLQPWPVQFFSPGIMGWYTFTPFMECYHGVLSLDHPVSGNLLVDGQNIDFAGGRGYIEKDWGKAFPSAYIWMQTNHFDTMGTSLTASVARIPWLGRAFRGEIVGLWHQGELYRFAKYTGAKTANLTLTDTHVHWELVGKTGEQHYANYRLEIDAERSKGGLLHAPYRIGMVERIVESLTAKINVRLIKLVGGKEDIIFAEQGRFGGLEVAGELEKLVDNEVSLANK
jgi:hypothetical protein